MFSHNNQCSNSVMEQLNYRTIAGITKQAKINTKTSQAETKLCLKSCKLESLSIRSLKGFHSGIYRLQACEAILITKTFGKGP